MRDWLIIFATIALCLLFCGIIWWYDEATNLMILACSATVISSIVIVSDKRLDRSQQTQLDMELHRSKQRLTECSVDYHLQKSVFENSTQLIDCVDENVIERQFKKVLSSFWYCDDLHVFIWEKGQWRRAGQEPDRDLNPPEIHSAIVLPDCEGENIILDLSMAVEGQAVLVAYNFKRQPSLDQQISVNEKLLLEVLRSQLTLALRRVSLYSQLQKLGRIDPLTNTWRRWYGEQRLHEIIDNGSIASVLMVDIDHFKSVNDRFGHAEGDRVLTAVGMAINDGIRTVDLAYRYGGEEFLVVLPDTCANEAQIVAERIRTGIADLHGLPDRITVSIGSATTRLVDGVPSLVERADKALYEAKSSGRNRLVNADKTTPESDLRAKKSMLRIEETGPMPPATADDAGNG